MKAFIPTMTPARIDRLLVVLAAAVLTVWSACFVHLWSYVVGTSGESSLMTLATLLLCVGPAMAFPGAILRAVRRFLGRGPFRRVLIRRGFLSARAGDAPGGRAAVGEAQALRNLLAASLLVAGVCGVASLAALPLARRTADWLGAAFVWTPSGWLVAGIVLRLAGLFPMAVGLAVVLLAGARARRGSGRDVYASIFRECLVGVGAALAAMAAAWWLGANLLALAMAVPVLLLAAAGAEYLRRGTTVRPPGASAPEEALRRPPRRIAIWATFAGLAAWLTAQQRLAADVLGLSFAPRAAWLAATLLLLAAFLRGEDRRAAPPARPREVGGLMGFWSVVLMQVSMVVLTLCGGALGGFCVALAAGAQAPLCALAAGGLCAQRRAHAIGGGSARGYLGGACGGMGLGVAACLLAGWAPGGVVALICAALGAVAWGACREIFLSPARSGQIQWALVGSALLVATAGGLLLAIRQAGGEVGAVETGAWLSAATPAGGEDEGPRPHELLPGGPPARSAAISAALSEVLARPASRGRWCFVVSSWADLPAELPPGVAGIVSPPDPSAWPRAAAAPGRAGGLLASDRLEGALGSLPRAGRGRFDGVLLAPMPADHPQAWRCYNEQAMDAAAGRLHPGGAMLLRTQVREEDGLTGAFAAASTFLQTVDSGWAAVALEDGWVDMLLGGPVSAVPPPEPWEGLVILPLSELLAPPLNAPPIRLSAPEAFRRQAPPDPARLRQRLRGDLASDR